MIFRTLLWPQRSSLLCGLITSCIMFVAPMAPLVQATAQAAPSANQTGRPVPSMPAPTEAPTQVTSSKPAADGAADQTGGKKIKPKKVKPKKVKKEKQPKRTHLTISDGILTVDGLAGKAALNYEIDDLNYLYIWAPGIGTAVISNHAFPLAKEQAAAFDDSALTVTADGHQLQLTSSRRLLGNKPASAWVLLDTTYLYPSKYPAVGYGSTAVAPFAWPGSRQNAASKDKSVVAPPLPTSLLPVQIPAACPSPGTQPAGCIPAKPAATPATMPTPSLKPQ